MKLIKIKFVDFWNGFIQDNNIIYNTLAKHFKVELSDSPQILFYSIFGEEHFNYKCIRVFYTSENIRANFLECDYAITFDISKNKNHLRLPLWFVYYTGYLENYGVAKLDSLQYKKEILEAWKSKKKFCCFIVSNPSNPERIAFFKSLNEVRKVDSAGLVLNNIGYTLNGGSWEKFKFIKDYKFVIAFENSSYPGYVTEKIIEPLMAGCIPIYWGTPTVNNDINTNRFINVHEYKNIDEVIKKIISIDNDDQLALSILTEKCFTDKQKSVESYINELEEFLIEIIEMSSFKKPIATNWIYSKANSILNPFVKFKRTFSSYFSKSLRLIKRIFLRY